MKQTAVEWLVENHFGSIENCSPNFRNHIEQANKMFEEQIETAFEEGMFHHTNGLCPDEYYEETFKSEE